MKWVLDIVGLLLILIGLVWMLQGVGILPGSFMTGQLQWAAAGVLALIIGAGLVARANRRTTGTPKASGPGPRV